MVFQTYGKDARRFSRLIVCGGFYSVGEPGTRDDFGEIIEAAWFAKGIPRQKAGRTMDNAAMETFFKTIKAELLQSM